MNISKKIAACAAACVILGTGAAAYAAIPAESEVSPAEKSDESTVSVEEKAEDAPIEDEETPIEAEDASVEDENVSADDMSPTGQYNSTVSLEDWAKQPHVLPSAYAPEDMDFFNTHDPDVYGSIGITIAAPIGSEVYVVDDGEVVYADYSSRFNRGCGNVVVVKHAENLYTYYEHMLKADENHDVYVQKGDIVKAGQCIGFVGVTGATPMACVEYVCCTEEPDLVDKCDWR